MQRWVIPAIVVLALLLAAFALAVVSWFANGWIVSAMATASLLAWLAAWLVVIYRRGLVRRAVLGGLIAGGLYVVLTMGPWFKENIGSSLLSSRLLSYIDQQRGEAGQTLTFVTTLAPQLYDTGLPGYPDMTFSGSGRTRFVTATPHLLNLSTLYQPAMAPSHTYVAGQWSFAWLLALAGVCLAWLISRPTSRTGEEQLLADAPRESNP